MLGYKHFLFFSLLIGFTLFFVALISFSGAYACYYVGQNFSTIIATILILLIFNILGLLVGTYMWLAYKIFI